MFVIDGRQVDLDLISIPQLDGLVIPNGLKKKLLDQLNWQDFIRSHCRRRNLGFSAQWIRQRAPDGSMVMDSAGAHSQVASFDPEVQRGLAGDGLRIFQITTLIDPDQSKPCKVMVALERN